MTRSMGKVIAGLNRLLEISEQFDLRSELVSLWSISLHVDHILKVNNRILDSIEKGVSSSEILPLSLVGRVVLALNYIPRGKAEAPGFVFPEEKNREELLRFIEFTKNRFEKLPKEILLKRIMVNHHRFGGMNPQQWLRFAYVHQHHHMKIIIDILK